jgi:hypothetical protein
MYKLGVFMGIINTIWNIFVLTAVTSYFGLLTSVTLKLGYSALSLHKKGLVSLSKYNRTLVGNETLK